MTNSKEKKGDEEISSQTESDKNKSGFEKVHSIIWLLAGFGLVFIGNSIWDQSSGGLIGVLGTGIGLFGNFLIIYAIYRGVRWLWRKIK